MTARLATLAFLLSAGAAQATPNWNGAGWYVVADTIYGPMVDSGPYASKEACEPNLSPSEPEADYLCEYLGERPSWDT